MHDRGVDPLRRCRRTTGPAPSGRSGGGATGRRVTAPPAPPTRTPRRRRPRRRRGRTTGRVTVRGISPSRVYRRRQARTGLSQQVGTEPLLVDARRPRAPWPSRASSPGPAPATTYVVFFETDDVTRPPRASMAALASSRVMVSRRAGEHELLAREGVGARRGAGLLRCARPPLAAARRAAGSPRVANQSSHRLGDRGPDLVDGLDLLRRGAPASGSRLRKWRARSMAARSPTKRMPRPKSSRRSSRSLLASMPARRFCADFSRHALEGDELSSSVQVVEVGEVAAPGPVSMSWRTSTSPRPSMSMASRPREVLEALLDLRRAGGVRAAAVHLALGLHRRRCRRPGTRRAASTAAASGGPLRLARPARPWG